jgi:hypothetical protein
MIEWLLVPFQVLGLILAPILGLWAFASFACILQGSYSHSKNGKAGFSESFGVCATQGFGIVIGYAILIYLSIRYH